MDKREYENIFKNEAIHFYYVSLHTLVVSLIRKYLVAQKQVTILDAGCGTGLLAKKLEIFGNVIGVDLSREAGKFAKKRGINFKLASITNLPFRPNSFDLIVCLDVLYHERVENDLDALKEFHRVLKSQGLLILRTSALPWLKTPHDKYVYTKRRYTKNELKIKLESSGFKIEKLSFINSFLLIPTVIASFREKLLKPQKQSFIKTQPNFINKLLMFLALLEGFLIQLTDIPIGVGLLAVCKKKSKS